MGEARKTVIVTTTFYKDNEEGRLRKGLADKFFRNAGKEGYHVVVVDGGTNNGNYIEDLNIAGIKAYPETCKGLGNSRREAIRYAHALADERGLDYVVWSEPEKVDLIRHLPFLEGMMDFSLPDVIVPARTSLKTYPTTQQLSEQLGNELHDDYGYYDSNRQPIDTFFGPKIWRANDKILKEFMRFDNEAYAKDLAQMRKGGDEVSFEEIGRAADYLKRWDHAQHMPVLSMLLKGGFNIFSYPIYYRHPSEQTQFEEAERATLNQKRLNQLVALNEQFALVKYLHKKERLD